jgi:hypothetical protein
MSPLTVGSPIAAEVDVDVGLEDRYAVASVREILVAARINLVLIRRRRRSTCRIVLLQACDNHDIPSSLPPSSLIGVEYSTYLFP